MSKSHDFVLKADFLLQGIGILIGWSSILTALDWFSDRFPGKSVGFWLTFLYSLPSLIFQPLSILYGHNFSLNSRIITTHIIGSLILILIPISVELASSSLGFQIVCVLIFLLGANNTICQCGLFEIAGMLPDEFTGRVMLGNGISGLLISGIRLICIFAFPRNSEGYFNSICIYFSISGAILILCVVAQMHLISHPFVIEHSNKSGVNRSELELKLLSKKDFVGIETNKDSIFSIISEIGQYFFLVWITFLITFGMLSYVALVTEAV